MRKKKRIGGLLARLIFVPLVMFLIPAPGLFVSAALAKQHLGTALAPGRSSGFPGCPAAAQSQGSSRPSQAGQTTGRAHVRPGFAREDCTSFNPGTAAVVNIQGHWKIVDGSHWIFDFDGKRDNAVRALRIIRTYRANQSCFVGRGQQAFQYLRVSGSAPSGAVPGEDCVTFNPATAAVENIRGTWKVVDGAHWVFDFGTNEAAARQALAIIKHYGFTHLCFVGRPNPHFKYLRK